MSVPAAPLPCSFSHELLHYQQEFQTQCFHLFVLISTDAIGAKDAELYLFIVPTDVNKDFFPLSLRLNVCKKKEGKKSFIFYQSNKIKSLGLLLYVMFYT